MKILFHRVVLLLSGIALFLDGWALVDFLRYPLAVEHSFGTPLYRAATVLVPLLLTLLVGFLIIRRVPGNDVGPLLILWSGSVAYNSIREGIGPVPFALFYSYNMGIGWLALFLMVLHFPDGKVSLPGAARWIYPLAAIDILMGSLVFLSTPHFDIPSQMANPFFVEALQTYSGPLLLLSLLLFAPLLLSAMISPVMRFRKGSPLERQQIKWLTLFAGSTIMYIIPGLIVYPLLSRGMVMNPGNSLFGMLFYFLTGLFPALAIGISILRYHLWEIDRLIRRTLVYSILTVILTLIYFGCVVLLRNVFAFFIQLNSSDLATVISTLAVAALFTPLRSRIQTYINRRFFRHKYDAEQILARFSVIAKGDVTLEPITAAFLYYAGETMQPEHMSLWLTPSSKKNLAYRETTD